ncbi:MAG TPA: hypothetical protein VFH89_11525, partial [Sphingomicrobium sp.]|nr:hypothetical protein [Sphingomicrobium sp.]
MHNHSLFTAAAAAAFLAGAAFAHSSPVDKEPGTGATSSAGPDSKINQDLLQAQVLLDEAGFSPG